MPPEAAPPANATPPAAVDDAAQAAADEQPLPPLDRDAEMKDQIARAKENVARDERKKARAEKKGSKGKAAPKAAPAPAPEVKVEPAATPEPEATEEEAPTRSLGSTVVEARKLFAAGDLDGAFRVNSAKWAEWRKANATASRQMAEREQKLAHGVKAVEEKFGGFVAAKKAFDAGDYSGALKQAFGVDPETFNKKLLAQFHGKHPEVEALRNELRARDEAETKRQQEAREAREREQQQQLIARNLELLGEHLGRSEDPAVVELAKKPRYRQRVLQVLRQHYDPESQTSIPLEQAAEMVKQEIEEEFGSVFRPPSASESPSRSGTTTARPATATLSNRGAAEASPPGRALSDEEQFRKYTNQLKHTA
jgi:hypothetical protein